MSCCVVDSLVMRRDTSLMMVSLFLLTFSGSMGMPLPLKRKNALEGPEVAGGVEGGRSSGLVSSRSTSLSEHNDGVGASVTEEECQDELGFIDRTGGGWDCETTGASVGWIDEVFSVEIIAKLDSADGAVERRRRGAPSRKKSEKIKIDHITQLT